MPLAGEDQSPAPLPSPRLPPHPFPPLWGKPALSEVEGARMGGEFSEDPLLNPPPRGGRKAGWGGDGLWRVNKLMHEEGHHARTRPPPPRGV